MPNNPQTIGSTIPKDGTFQWQAKRIAGLTLVIPAGAGVSSVNNRRIVTIQQDGENNMFAVLGPVATASPVTSVTMTIIGWGVLEQALQSGGVQSISPTPNTFVNGDQVVVLCDVEDVYAIDYDPCSFSAIQGIGNAYVDKQGRLSATSTGGNVALLGAVFSSVPGVQLANQLAAGAYFFRMYSPLHP